jgi:4-amino-4-deoxy-L-arabinose transferase-like glycosyltransferase
MSKKHRKKTRLVDTDVRPDQVLPWDEPFRHQKWLILILLVAALGVRLWLLIASRHYLRSDEAVVAMEALDIMEGGPVPFFLYGQFYGGGQTVDALMAIPLFALFSPSEYLFKLVQILLSMPFVFVIYWGLYQFIGKRYALIAMAVFSFFSTFIQFSFFYNGGMAMSLFGWLGLYFFFRTYFDDEEKPVTIALCGVSLGFACYCFEYAYYYLAAVLALWILKENIHLWRSWRQMLCFAGGFLLGALPLIYFNFTHDFANFRSLLTMNSRPDSNMLLSILNRFGLLLSRDLPSFFSLSIDDFSEHIPLASYIAYGIFLISLIYTVIRNMSGIIALARAFFSGRKAIVAPGERMVYILLLLFMYFVIYSLSSSGGSTPRYLIAVYPLIPFIVAWAAYDLGKRHFVPAAIVLGLFMAIQAEFIVDLSRDTTLTEWHIQTHGRDIKALARYLLDNNFTTVLTPYEIKWRLMFESGRRIVCAAYAFGFDRENKYNMEVIERVNRKGMPLTVVFDREYKMPQIALNFNPMGAFDLAGFHQFLQQNKITYQRTPVGEDYIVYHNFSKHFSIPDPYTDPLGARFGLTTASP